MRKKKMQVVEKNTVPALRAGDYTPSQIMAMAVERSLAPETLSKLMDVQERWEANQAKKAYVEAMTAFKLEAPAVLLKDSQVNFTNKSGGKTQYTYANLGSIVQRITTLLGKHQLSASWSTNQANGGIAVTCNITHVSGHREAVTLEAPPDGSGGKNSIQAVGSTVTYLQRYTLLAALGLATGTDDDDGRSYGQSGEPYPQDTSAPKEPPKKKEVDPRTKVIDTIEAATKYGWSMPVEIEKALNNLMSRPDKEVSELQDRIVELIGIYQDELIEGIKQATEGKDLTAKQKSFLKDIKKKTLPELYNAMKSLGKK